MELLSEFSALPEELSLDGLLLELLSELSVLPEEPPLDGLLFLPEEEALVLFSV